MIVVSISICLTGFMWYHCPSAELPNFNWNGSIDGLVQDCSNSGQCVNYGVAVVLHNAIPVGARRNNNVIWRQLDVASRFGVMMLLLCHVSLPHCQRSNLERSGENRLIYWLRLSKVPNFGLQERSSLTLRILDLKTAWMSHQKLWLISYLFNCDSRC